MQGFCFFEIYMEYKLTEDWKDVKALEYMDLEKLLMKSTVFKNDFNIVYGLGRSLKRADDMFDCCYRRQDFKFIDFDINKDIPDVGNTDYIIHAASNTHPIDYSTLEGYNGNRRCLLKYCL